jgi:hypothetical protein
MTNLFLQLMNPNLFQSMEEMATLQARPGQEDPMYKHWQWLPGTEGEERSSGHM